MASKQLAALKGMWKRAKASNTGKTFDDLDDGRYLAIISDTELNESNNDRLQTFLEYKVQEGEFEGKSMRNYIGLDTEVGIQITINTYAKLGIEIEDPSEIEEKIKLAVGKICKIQVKTKGDYKNIYILKVIGSDPAMESAATHSNETVEEPEVEDAPDEPVVDEPVVENDDSVELQKGMVVTFNWKKQELEGKVIKIEEKEGNVIVSCKGKNYRVASDTVLV